MALTPRPINKTLRAAAEDPLIHRFQLALMQGDILVLSTYASQFTDELDIVEVFRLEGLVHSPRFEWAVTRLHGSGTVHGSDRRDIHPFVHMGAKPPLSLVSKPRGICTLFTFDVRHGYSLNYPALLEDRFPDIYEQLDLS